MNIFWWNGTVLNNFFNLGNCYFRCLAHCCVESKKKQTSCR
jgi:hypothetical protein